MKQVWKYEIDPDETPIDMPLCAEILSVGFQGDILMLWALVDLDVDLVPRKIYARGTGHNIRADSPIFIGTAFKDGLVFHVFEELC